MIDLHREDLGSEVRKYFDRKHENKTNMTTR